MLTDDQMLTALGLHEAGMDANAIVKNMRLDVPAKRVRKLLREMLGD